LENESNVHRAVATVLDLRPLLAELELAHRTYRQAVTAFLQVAGEDFSLESASRIQLAVETTAEAVHAYREALTRYHDAIQQKQEEIRKKNAP
jgi:flagellar biosynthesis chaperone FliJ